MRSTTSEIRKSEVSSKWASAAGWSGDTARAASRASRSRMSCKRRGRLTSDPFCFNCLYRRSARTSGVAVKNTFNKASGNTVVPMSRPSATSPGGRRSSCCFCNKASRTAGTAATREADSPAVSVRNSSPISAPSSCTVAVEFGFGTNRMSTLPANCASAAPSARLTPARRAATPTARYSAPLSK